jgi:RimJ/RimL family protein N-acetyltransferase
VPAAEGPAERLAPRVETERLILRPHRPDDLTDCAAMWSHPEVVRHIGGRPFTLDETWGRILRYAGLWALLGYGYWAIEEKSSGRFIGDVGLADFKRDVTPPLDAPETGWALSPSAHNQGFATEAVRATLAWIETQRGPTRTVCLIDPQNQASVRVALKCGYRELTRATYKGQETLVFER